MITYVPYTNVRYTNVLYRYTIPVCTRISLYKVSVFTDLKTTMTVRKVEETKTKYVCCTVEGKQGENYPGFGCCVIGNFAIFAT